MYAPLWRHLSEFTALGAGPATDLCLFLEQTGYVAAPGPFLATALYQSLTGDDEHTGTVAFVDDAMNPFVLEADRVDRIAIVGPGPTVAVVDTDAVRDRMRFVANVDFSRRVFQLDANDLDLDPKSIDADAYAAWLDRAHVAIAAEMTGTARRIFDMSLAYAKEREQFDRPIGSFQAIQHKLADMALALQRATAAVQYGAMTCDAAGRRSHARLPFGQGRGGRGGAAHPQGRRADPRWDRLHVGARPAPLPAARHCRRGHARHHELAPRSHRGPAVRNGLRDAACTGRAVRRAGETAGRGTTLSDADVRFLDRPPQGEA